MSKTERPDCQEIEWLQEHQSWLRKLIALAGGYDSKHPELMSLAAEKWENRSKLRRLHKQAIKYHKQDNKS